ncbi:MAG: DUF1178 family protein [Alphaproteobacteria bacterium]|nr:DUF1178 family protein [Alphaproteobacteria bacterium]
MISYNLRCAKDHVFEAWFQNSAAYEEQVGKKTVACPTCGSKKVEKSIMAPSVARSGGRSDDLTPEKMAGMLVKLRETVEENCDYVGGEFPEEARKIHYGETEHRDIYGEASEQEAEELAEEGIEFGRIPWVPRTNS